LGQSNDAPKNDIEIIDISQKQLSLMNKYRDLAVSERNLIFLDSIYRPYSYMWNGYLGNEDKFIKWLNEIAFRELSDYNQRAIKLDLIKLNNYFHSTVDSMRALTGLSPLGKWYIFYGPKWTNLGGFSDGTMLIDLANKYNNKFETIVRFFPHEINHQIYSTTVPTSSNVVLSRILDEGFACYVSFIFNQGKTRIFEELDYTKKEYNLCLSNHADIISIFKQYYLSTDKNLAEDFADRNYKFNKKYAGALGYYIGFKIVESYVNYNGKDSWKDIYRLSPEIVLEKSKILR
jgi:hypothetical protein